MLQDVGEGEESVFGAGCRSEGLDGRTVVGDAEDVGEPAVDVLWVADRLGAVGVWVGWGR